MLNRLRLKDDIYDRVELANLRMQWSCGEWSAAGWPLGVARKTYKSIPVYQTRQIGPLKPQKIPGARRHIATSTPELQQSQQINPKTTLKVNREAMSDGHITDRLVMLTPQATTIPQFRTHPLVSMIMSNFV
jgi:hypothetical protein